MTSKSQSPLIADDQLGVNGDPMYGAFLSAHSGLTDEQSHRLNARLVLLLMNQLADPIAFDQVLAAARSVTLTDISELPSDSADTAKS